MSTWVNRAAENGLKVNTNEGTQVPITGASFDLNEYWEGYPKLSLKKYKPIAARNEDANVSRGLL